MARKSGALEVIYIRDPIERFWSKVNKTATCWLWVGRCGPDGYGHFNHLRRQRQAHRWLWIALNGPLADDVQLDHLCRVRNCVNPDHLEPVTAQVNTLRGIGPSAENARKTHCKRGHEFSPENTYVYHSRRHCRTCRRIADQARRTS